MDKRELGRSFRSRLQRLIDNSDGNHVQFARAIGLDRSALSQFLAEGSTRLPRAETLAKISEVHKVSLDWLLGLTHAGDASSALSPALEVKQVPEGKWDTPLELWHSEAIGYKIRYVPQSIPDLLRLDDATLHEFAGADTTLARTKIREAEDQLAYSRRPETDIEICMPRQTLETLASGSGLWTGLSNDARRRQLTYMARLLSELYPTVRLFLYDGRQSFSSPYTVFGPLRAALYIGDMFLVLNHLEHVRSLSQHFDNLIRNATIGPDRAPDFITDLITNHQWDTDSPTPSA